MNAKQPETTPHVPVSPTPTPAPAPQPWCKPTFARLPLVDALGGFEDFGINFNGMGVPGMFMS